MTKTSLLFSLLLAAGLSAPSLATEENTQSSLAIKSTLAKAVGNGKTIEEAVGKEVKQQPEQGGETVAAALNILERLPKRACAVRTREGNMRLASHIDYQACSDRIVRAAIAAGADPSEVSKATAAGVSYPRTVAMAKTSTSENGSSAEVGPIELLLRKVLLLSSHGQP